MRPRRGSSRAPRRGSPRRRAPRWSTPWKAPRFESRIDLAWEAPDDTGNSAIEGYLIEWSPDGTSDWRELVADTGNLDVAYSDQPLDPGTTRHYRISAINDDGPGRVSDAAFATTGPVPRQAGTNARGTQVAIDFEPALDATPGTRAGE